MNAIITAILSNVRHRKLQSFVVAFVVLLTSAAATLALSLAVESDAPYDHAFAQAHGAHLIVGYSNRVSAAQLRRTALARDVTAAAGPWPQIVAIYSHASAGGGTVPVGGLFIVGRTHMDGPVDRLTLESGRWVQARGEVVVSQLLADSWHLSVGDDLNPADTYHGPILHVVGVAASINPFTDAWVVPQQIHAMTSHRWRLQYQMVYRVRHAATEAELNAAAQTITASVPRGDVVGAGNYLEAKHSADTTTATMIPFLLAFSAFALLASVLIIVNVVTGVVIAAYRDIGIMKSVGFSPVQVMLVLLGQILVPAILGCLLGIALGTLASQPFLRQTAHAFGLPAPFTAVIPVNVGVLALMIVLACAAALVPAHRASRLSAVTAITRGAAPAAGTGSRLAGIMAGLPLPRAIGLGLADSFARPLRSAMTIGAILTGVATMIFALNLHLSLNQVADHVIRDKYVQVDVYPAQSQTGSGSIVKGGPGSGPAPSSQQVEQALRGQPGTARFVPEAQANVVIPGIPQSIPYIAYRGPSAWTGYALISGHWFSRPGDVVAPTRLLHQAHLRVGDTITAHIRSQPMRLHIVGEILDTEYDDLLLRGTWATLAAAEPRLVPQEYEVQLQPGVIDPALYARQLQRPGMTAQTNEHPGMATAFSLLNGVIAGLAVVLTVIAGAGVFNSVVLTTREKARTIAILKAVGMAPVQVITMVLSSTVLLGLVGGVLAIPVGLVLHRQILMIMAQIASGSGIPPSFFDLIDHALLPLLALMGIGIATLGAWLPAQWAASRPAAPTLQAE
jgi:putative ABC transport system permease protein